MKSVIAVIDIGKTNKKIFLFDEKFEVIFTESTRFDEITDDDNYACDDIESIEKWIQYQIKKIQKEKIYTIKAINFTTHGATVVYLDKNGKRVTPLYNYLKPLEDIDFNQLYNKNGGVSEFSRKTASPAYGMLNAGLQMYWLKQNKPRFWDKVDTILHYPQYLSYLFTKKITSDFTSVGAHTAIWDFDSMDYHQWLKDEQIRLPKPSNGKEAIMATINGEQIAVGSGLHDSSSSIIPLLMENEGNEFILLSTGTWIISMNPFSKETLTQFQLNNNCLCFMTPEKKQVKSSMLFLGRMHEVYVKALAKHFNVDEDTHLTLKLNKKLCSNIISNPTKVFLAEGSDTEFTVDITVLNNFNTYEHAYYQLVFDICKKVMDAIELILDTDNSLKNIYISGGFNKNKIFVDFLSLLKPNVTIRIPNGKNESALGAALLMKEYLNEPEYNKK
ncbi:FGGY family carbohydrate kinase [Flavicella sp.]|uniref:FGGY family carbohydrate kinase n=1 Tax=Flavicella sp. TaxID=2957742 RepID=UPI003019E2AB